MGAQKQGNGSTGSGNSQRDAASGSVGHRTSGEAGSTPEHETQGETGGSGGSGMTGNQVSETAKPSAQPGSSEDGDACNVPAEPPGSYETAVARGPQDTRSEQAGWSKTGLGVPETGANQSADDLERKHKPK